MRPRVITKILIVDDHPLVRVGMATVVNQQPDMTVVGMAEDSRTALELLRLHQPDVVLMDLRLRGESGAEITAAIHQASPSAQVLVISNYEGDEDIRQALSSGAMGYLFKSIVEDELVDAIREVRAGRRYLPTSVAVHLQEHESDELLTSREDELLELLGKGLRNREMAEVLGVSDETIKTHLKSVFRKLGVSDRAAAVRAGIQRGFIRG